MFSRTRLVSVRLSYETLPFQIGNRLSPCHRCARRRRDYLLVSSTKVSPLFQVRMRSALPGFAQLYYDAWSRGERGSKCRGIQRPDLDVQIDSMNPDGKVTLPAAHETVTLPLSSGCQRPSFFASCAGRSELGLEPLDEFGDLDFLKQFAHNTSVGMNNY